MLRRAVVSMLLLCTAAAAQAPAEPAAPLAFEVASIRLHPGPLHSIMEFQPAGPRLTLGGYNLHLLIQEAFGLKGYQVTWSPGVSPASDTYYDIIARAEGDASPTHGEFQQMLQTLLMQRFHLRFHQETRDLPVYLLTVDKRGSRLQPSDPKSSEEGLFGVHGRNQTINMPRDSMPALADQLHDSFGLGRPVLDKTGLTGTYNIHFEATPEFNMGHEPHSEDLTVFTAVTEQLGLKLETSKAPMPILVVDHMEAPSEN